MTQQVVPLSVGSPEPDISVIIPVYNEEENLRELGERLMSTLSAMGRPFEIILVDDGSTDRSWEILTELNQRYPQNLRALRFHRNFGQHPAIFAGFQASRGRVMITLDADLQNPPEEIPRLVAKLEEGYDTVGGWRENRQRLAVPETSLPSDEPGHVQGHRGPAPGLRLHAAGLPPGGGGQHQPVPGILQLHSRPGQYLFPAGGGDTRGPLPAGAGQVQIQPHQAHPPQLRPGDRVFQSAHPAVGFMGVAIAALGLLFGLFLFIRRIFIGPEVGGIFTLFAILFVFVGLNTLGLALIGEYVGRIYREVRAGLVKRMGIIKNVNLSKDIVLYPTKLLTDAINRIGFCSDG